MKPTRFPVFAAVLALVLGCRPHGHDHHDHGHEDHDHDHDHHAPADPRPGLSVTLYQGPLELFMEYPAFVMGVESPLLAHLTDTRDSEAFLPVTRGLVVATLRFKSGAEETFRAETPLRDGLFKPVVKPSQIGEATLSLELVGAQVEGTVEVGPVVVHPSIEAAVAGNPVSPAAETPVSFLKEQQWKTRFATAAAELRAVRPSVRVFGELRGAPGREADLNAPIAGRVEVTGAPLRPGQAVRRGELLLVVTPVSAAGGSDRSGLELEERRARAELGLAERELERAQGLFAAQAIAEKQVDAARVAVDVAEARLRSATAQLLAFRSAQANVGSGRAAAHELRAPFDGVVSHTRVTPGVFVEAGTVLVGVIDPRELALVAHVPEQDLSLLETLGGAGLWVDGHEGELPVALDQLQGVSPTLDPRTRTAELTFAVPNPTGGLRAGQSARVVLYGRAGADIVAVPRQAVIDDNGKPTVYVVDGGESFLVRRVEVGPRDGEWLALRSGLGAGDRVVSRGAYEIKLATAAGAMPAHGHAH
jgi:RND family efflux transporter MFP subunit